MDTVDDVVRVEEVGATDEVEVVEGIEDVERVDDVLKVDDAVVDGTEEVVVAAAVDGIVELEVVALKLDVVVNDTGRGAVAKMRCWSIHSSRNEQPSAGSRA